MPWKSYSYIRPNGWRNTFKMWVKTDFTYGHPKEIYSRRFGYLNLYKEKEQKALICPSGYSISQCFYKLRLMWLGYKKAKGEGKLDQMKKYALQIQDVQKDMGIDVASFPFLGIFGEKFVLYDKGTKKPKVNEDHRKYLKAQEMRNLKLEVGKDEEIQTLVDDRLHEPLKQEATVPLLVEPEMGEEVLIMADEVPFQKCPVCEKCGQFMSFDKKHECPEKDELEVLSDSIPFRNQTT